MGILVFLLIVLIALGWFIGTALVDILFPKKIDRNFSSNENITINYNITEQHLHITSNNLEELRKPTKDA